MREIVLDTETTGLSPEQGDRVVEIGAVELVNHLPTGREYHQYINPERDMPEGAFKVHGLSSEFLSDKPLFAKIAQQFLDFIGDAQLVIHNAGFDMKFLNMELTRAGRKALPMTQATDTLEIARIRYPGAQNTLDGLCRRFSIDTSEREAKGHGALLDSQILAEVYLELRGGRQPGLVLDATASPGAREATALTSEPAAPRQRPRPLAPRLTEEERAAHAEFVATLTDPLWKQL